MILKTFGVKIMPSKLKKSQNYSVKNNVKSEKKINSNNHRLYNVCIVIITFLCGYIHRSHVYGMFERHRHFSHLSTLERELSFRTEMGLYYSYYKTIVESPSFISGLHTIMNDNLTEYPLVINTLKRFNLYPEVVLSAGYRVYNEVCRMFNIVNVLCWRVNRGDDLDPVNSCEGLGEPIYFYIESVFFLHGILMSVYFLFGKYLSGSIFGGLLTVACVFFNHGEGTRVQWTPPLRESFSYPFYVIQAFIVTSVIRNSSVSMWRLFLLTVFSSFCILSWQFAQFVFLTQLTAVFGTYIFGYMDSKKFQIYIYTQAVSLALCYILLFGNEMLFASFYFSSIITSLIIINAEPIINRLRYRLAIFIFRGILFITGIVGLKLILLRVTGISDDAHIGDLLRSKFTDFKSFHTMLYTCAVEFNFIEKTTIVELNQTLLIPTAVVCLLLSVFLLLRNLYNNNTSDNEDGVPTDSELLFHILQLFAFTIMALLVMRLKLFWTPALCLFSSLIASRKLVGFIKNCEIHYSLVVMIVAGMAVKGYVNLSHQLSVRGEFSNFPMEQLMDWINSKPPPNSVFAGAMPTMATVRLCTKQPIVNHPHYEDAGQRNRTKKVYTIYSRKPPSEVYQNLNDLMVDYVILDENWCYKRSSEGCSLPEIWDLEDHKNHGRPSACDAISKYGSKYFQRVFRNEEFTVYRLIKSVNRI